MKKFVLAVVVVALVFAQAFFIYAFQHGATSDFESFWRGFGVSQSAYSHFVFRTIKWWWALPIACLSLLTLALWRPRRALTILVLFVSLSGTIALYWSAYAPSLFVDI